MRESNVLSFPAATGLLKPGSYLRGTISYGEIDAVNQSTLKEILVSPLHYQWRLTNPKASTDSMARGTACHTAVLEPTRLAAEYAIWEDYRTDDKTGKEVKQVRNGAIWDQFQQQHAGKTIVREKDLADAMRMQRAVTRDRIASRYLYDGKGSNEVTLIWSEPTTRTLCKARLDRCGVLDGQHVVIDLKGCQDAGRAEFAKQAARMGYHFQAAFYVDAYEAVYGVRPAFMVVAVEMSAPHDVAVYELGDADLDKGRRLYQEALSLRAECIAAKSWPGVGGNMVQPLTLPDWAPGGDNDNGFELVIGGQTVGV